VKSLLGPLRIRLLVLAILLSAGNVALGASEAPDALGRRGGSPFQVQARIGRPELQAGGQATVLLEFRCAPQHYVWHDTVRVRLAETTPSGISIGGLVLPPPKRKVDPLAGGEVGYLDGTFEATLPLHVGADVPPGTHEVGLEIRFTGCGPDLCMFPRIETKVKLAVTPAAAPTGPAPAAPEGDGRGLHASQGAPQKAAGRFAGRSPLIAILIAYLAGLGLSLTPCVYPLIPITIALVGATSARGRLDALVRSAAYVFGISVTYSVVGVVAAATGGLFGAVLQHPAVYVALAVVFVVLAGGMLDLYTIELTSQRLGRLQAVLRGRAGLVGIWATGLLSGAAATACIAPVVISAFTYVAQRGNLLLGWLVFFSLAWGMGTPLVVVGTFTGLLKSLPKGGEWMVTVKHLFGFALVAAAVFFVGRSRLMPDAWYRALWLSALALGGLVVAFYRRWPRSLGPAALRAAVVVVLLAVPAVALMRPAETATGIEWLESEQEALRAARATGKPVLLDFWADWCEPCRRMFNTTYADAAVVAESRRFVCARVNIASLQESELDRITREYDLRGVPTTVFVATDGQRGTHVGYIGPEEMLALMRNVR